jgi:hypothetical protein
MAAGANDDRPWERLCALGGTDPGQVAGVARAGNHRHEPRWRHRAAEITYLADCLDANGHRVALPEIEAAHDSWAQSHPRP